MRPSPGPFRVHRMERWYPEDWKRTWSDERIGEHVSWERDTLHPKYGIEFGIEYTHAAGVAQLADLDRFFGGFFWRMSDNSLEKRLGIAAGSVVMYHPRRAYDLWNTRYFIVPFDVKGWRDPVRGSASFEFQSQQVYPDSTAFSGPSGAGGPGNGPAPATSG